MQSNKQKENNLANSVASYLNGTLALETLNFNNLSMNELINLFADYASCKYITNDKTPNLLNAIIDTISNKLSSMSLIKVIDLYIVFFNKSLLIEDTMIGSKNILSVMSYHISDEGYIEKEIKKKKITKDKFIDNCKKDLTTYSSMIDLNEKILSFYNNLLDKILLFIESNLHKITNQEKKYLFDNLNSRFEINSEKLLEAIKNENKGNIREVVNYNDIKNSLIVYESFRDTLLEKNDN